MNLSSRWVDPLVSLDFFSKKVLRTGFDQVEELARELRSESLSFDALGHGRREGFCLFCYLLLEGFVVWALLLHGLTIEQG